MPHIVIHHSNDLEFDAINLFKAIEKAITAFDPSSGACKGRAFAADAFFRTHINIEITLLPKAHRDAEFTKTLSKQLVEIVKGYIKSPCAFAFSIKYADEFYIMGEV